MTRRAVLSEPATSLQRTCPTCCVEPGKLCKRPNGKHLPAGKNGGVHKRRTYVPAPLSHFAVTSAGHGHVRNGRRGAHALCGVAVTLEPVSKVRVSCQVCYSTKAHLLAHPTATARGARLLPLEGGVPDDATV